MEDKEDYLTAYRVFFENFAATVNPEDQLPVHIAGYTITEAELPGEVIYWTTQYLTEKACPPPLMMPLQRIILDEVQIAAKKQPNDYGFRAHDSVYTALQLMQAATAKVNEVCLRYLDNARLVTLPPPPVTKDLLTASSYFKNLRRAMEDRHIEIGNLEEYFGMECRGPPTSFYAVYDGHAGTAAASYCAAHLHRHLAASAHYRTDLRRALQDAFLRADREFVNKCNNEKRVTGGTTAVVVCVRGRRLLAAWAGDSQALLAKRMQLMQLVSPHKPSREDEKDRVVASGGTVMHWGTWRVNGQLAVSRAIGDHRYKPYVTACPEITTVDLDGDEDFVVIACDGLWDFVSEDLIAYIVYKQLAKDPDDLDKVPKRLIKKALDQNSRDNISVIVVFLKDPRLIATDYPPMELGLDNGLASAPPFVADAEACKLALEMGGGGGGGGAGVLADGGDNGVDSSDSDSEDLGPETAVDADHDVDNDADPDDVDAERPPPRAPTPPATPTTPVRPADHVEENHAPVGLVDNVAESGDESEDEWNYFKGEGDREEQVASDVPDEPPRSPTSCQDNSGWESSSVDMNSSPLNPDAPVFVPCGAPGATAGDVLLAESPRKPLPMDDVEVPDVAQFRSGADHCPADLQELDNCDHLNGHHNISIDEATKEKLNGNEKCNTDILGFGFNVGVDSDKTKDTSLIQDLERIQKDTTDFCDIQVFQAHTEISPDIGDIDEELFERLKNKERDPMSMSFYQEKDDDTCERLVSNESQVDLNAVQLLPDSEDEESTPNGVSENVEDLNEKENTNPDQPPLIDSEKLFDEPNNDIVRFDEKPELINSMDIGQGDNFNDYNVITSSDTQLFSNIDFECNNINVPGETVLQTDTPESHKLLFEQIPEIPDGKSSELGFASEDIQESSEGDRDNQQSPLDETSQDVDMESKTDDIPCNESDFLLDDKAAEQIQSTDKLIDNEDVRNIICDEIPIQIESKTDSFETDFKQDNQELNLLNGELESNNQENVNNQVEDTNVVKEEYLLDTCDILTSNDQSSEKLSEIENIPEVACDIRIESESLTSEHPLHAQSPLPIDISLPRESPLPTEILNPIQSLATHTPLPDDSFQETPLPESPLPVETLQLSVSPAPTLPMEVEILSPTTLESPTQDRVEFESESSFQFKEDYQNEPLQSRLTPETHEEEVRDERTSENVPQQMEDIHIEKYTSSIESRVEPTPDIVPENPAPEPSESLFDIPSEPVTDIDIGVAESRAQEICVPVTEEIRESAAPVASPAPVVEHLHDATPVADTLIAADVPAPAPAPAATPSLAPVAAVAVAGAAAVVASVAAAAKTKSPAVKKSPAAARPSPAVARATPKTTATPRTPLSATKKTASTTSASKPSMPTAAAKTTPTAKSSTTPSRPAPARAPAAARSAPSKPSSAPAKPASAARSAPRPAAATARTAAPPKAPAAAAPKLPIRAPRPAPATKAPEKKPLTNGDAKIPPIRRPAPAKPGALPAAPAAAAAPATTRPTPRPTPRALPTATATLNKVGSVPRAAPRPAPRPAAAALDKGSKDLANRRLTAKAAPPRTAANKAPLGGKSVPVKITGKKMSEASKVESVAPDRDLPDVIA